MAKKKRKYVPKTKEQVLDKLKKNDKFNLLVVRAKNNVPNDKEFLIETFEEVNVFIDEMKRLPDGKSSPIEFRLYQRILEINLDDSKIVLLKDYDRHQILKSESVQAEEVVVQAKKKEPKETKLGLKDKFGLLGSSGNSIFKLKNVKKHSEKVTTMPEKVAKRKKCKDFAEFRPLFEKCQKEIENGDRRVVKFRNEHDVKVGSFFIYGGVTCYVSEIGEIDKNNRNNARLRLIFENERESNMLRRSLTAELYKDGRRILPPRSEGGDEITDEESTGYIYILRSKSELEEIKNMKDLYKIGFSTTPVKDRIKNAKEETTYLMAEVKEIASFKVSGITPRYFEKIIHTLFDHVRLDIDVVDNKGVTKKPKEWFKVPYDVIEDVIHYISNGEISNYVYDAKQTKLVRRS